MTIVKGLHCATCGDVIHAPRLPVPIDGRYLCPACASIDRLLRRLPHPE